MRISNDFLKLLHNELKNREKVKELQENPLEESEIRDIIVKSDLENKVKHQYLAEIGNLKKAGLGKDDYVPTFEEFSKDAESQGKYPIKTSTFKQMTPEQQRQFTTKKPAFYPDMKQDDKVVHYQYKDTAGYQQKTGDGIGVIHHNTQNAEVIQKASKQYGEAQTEIKKILADIEVRGDVFTDYMKESK